MQYDLSETPVNTSRLGITSQYYISAKCEVRNERLHYLNEIHASKPGTMAQSFSHRPLNTEDRIWPVRVGFVVDKVALGQVFLRVVCLYSVTVNPLMFHVRFYMNTVFIRRTSGRSRRNLKKRNAPFKVGGTPFSRLKGLIKKAENKISSCWLKVTT
jgi:hypothetical protein